MNELLGFYVLATAAEARDPKHPKWQKCRERAMLMSKELQPILHPANLCMYFFLFQVGLHCDLTNGCSETLLQACVFQFQSSAPQYHHQLYLVASRCCPASYANTNSKPYINCRIIETAPPVHDRTKGYPALADFISVLRCGMVKLQVLHLRNGVV